MEKKSCEITFEITEHLDTLYTNPKSGWTKEINMVSWRGKPAKIDIREWDPEHTKMGKGVTLSFDEAEMVKEALEKVLK